MLFWKPWQRASTTGWPERFGHLRHQWPYIWPYIWHLWHQNIDEKMRRTCFPHRRWCGWIVTPSSWTQRLITEKRSAREAQSKLSIQLGSMTIIVRATTIFSNNISTNINIKVSKTSTYQRFRYPILILTFEYLHISLSLSLSLQIHMYNISIYSIYIYTLCMYT